MNENRIDERDEAIFNQQLEKFYQDIQAHRGESGKFVIDSQELEGALRELGEDEEFKPLVLAASEWEGIPLHSKLLALTFFDKKKVIRAVSNAMDADVIEEAEDS